jgi:hypothetical protein
LMPVCIPSYRRVPACTGVYRRAHPTDTDVDLLPIQTLYPGNKNLFIIGIIIGLTWLVSRTWIN